ncbi:M48 family metallopeptidase [Chitinilyticum piscinae]|uniref:M48 family metallopeptidase n=1 Tax=Chitinilyticum piscinae TaxID=2866724 RepID=A0A8J7FH41_9NEIS|nr:SprT family zinc-dependent metalloprotease [Chitinilyticum piscinae]MBE9609070.1 M48 family metallopeptidase [Chitinilyticum piscinae]
MPANPATQLLDVDLGLGRRLALHWTRSPRRRTVQLLVHADGRVELKSPLQTRWAAVEPFIRSRADWLLAARSRMLQRAEQLAHQQPDPLQTLHWFGQALPVRPARRTRLLEDAIELAGGDDREAQLGNIQRFMQRTARGYLRERLDLWAMRMNTSYSAFALSSARGRWGSCSALGAIRLNWRLLQAPPEVIDYVVIHELAHRFELNHSPRFWAIVERHCPDWRLARDHLKREGAGYMQL